jgi:hypothetical protein
MSPRFHFHRPHLDWLADLALLGALAGLVMATAVLCSFVPWS